MMDEEGRKVGAEIERGGGRAVYIDCDVSNPEQVKRAIDRTAEAFGRIDVVFANAGINGVWAPIEELKPEEWDQTLDTNLKSTFLTVKYAIPHLRRAGGGSIIITSSINGNRKFSNPGATAYSTSKAGQVAFMKMAALELSRYQIRVNAVCPGAIHTNIDERTRKRDTEKVEIKVELPEGKPGVNEGQGEPIDVADAVLFLASDMSRHVSGVELYVDGGSSLML
jgi:NAD(P)-dependent dehydrogenase (short-subunit alcohol dehydrogenase family)